MNKLPHALLAILCILSGPLFAQTPVSSSSSVSFQIADVHTSPHTLQPFPRSTFAGGVFFMRQANLVDLIAKTYGVDPANVAGGPDCDRL